MTIPDTRLRRTPAAREAPIRAVQAAARAIAPDSPGTTPPPPPAAVSAVDAVIAQAVETAYRIADENVVAGRRAAERLTAAARPPGDPGPNARDAANRLMHVSKELGASWADLIGAVLREPELKALLERLTQREPKAEPARNAAAAISLPMVQRVRSRKLVEVAFAPLPDFGADAAPGLSGLYALDPDRPPLRNVTLRIGAKGVMEIQVDVPDDQPADVYAGTVVDTATHLPIAVLTVTVLE